ncbi:thymidine phosphorylase [Pseudomonas sp. HAR-UPW-AIA-41]|uniref:DUF1631 domain-containing protein n=1 Tax=Pseudomonas sp. HAR-UPW-AIA-41 TaxID=1985301 RepID=UPI000BB39F2E|nr:DUF1631 domain-containing protein [Pseudomonas sp. HAR-UPW-AIA-41]PAV47649.1 thymidine phosphorylase [Pseudomonas sp. HAR-UPW-AIA-41]
MQTDANVVPLNRSAPEHTSNTQVGRLPVALTQLRDKAAMQLKQDLQALFDNADDSLFEMADRATSNAEQNDLFEAMRELRLKRKSIANTFLRRVFEGFAELARYSLDQPPQLTPVTLDSLSLMQNDELEESVAVDAMVAKILSRDAQALHHLTTRINTLIHKKIDEASNPLGPRPVCESFVAACADLGVDIRIKLIIYKLFEKYVLSEIGQLYAEANQILVQAGVLPELKSAPPAVRQPRAGARPAVSAPTASESPAGFAGASEDMQEAFAAFQGLMTQLRGTALPQRELPADAVPITSNDLTRLLSHLQQHLPAASQISGEELREKLDLLLSKASAKSGKTRVVGQVDDDAINLISMLFEFILDDRALPDSLKALIARLQIPMLKVAVQDKAFFNRGSHPARRLLNEIASAALGWSEHDAEKRDSLYQKIEHVVQRLLNDFVDDPRIFSELLADFVAFTGSERRRSELLEQRMRDAEEGRAKSEQARLEVEQALNQRLLGKTLPAAVVRLLQEAWSKVLLLVNLKHGGDSQAWREATATMDDLVWSASTPDTAEDRLRLLQMVPGLLRSLRAGMAEASLDPFVVNELFAGLEALHVQAFQRMRQEPEADAVVSAVEAQALSEVAEVLPLDSAPEISEPAPMVEVVEEIVLLAPGERRDREEQPVVEDEAVLAQVDALRVGSWVEIQEDEEHKLRCKLAAVIKPSGKFIFVNRTGMKVLEKTRMGLAVEFRRQAVRLLDDALLFDRALESVIGNLRRMKGA